MDLLFEIGCEEIPHTSIPALIEQLHQNTIKELSKNEITHDFVQNFSSPRRLAVLVHNVIEVVPAKEMIKKGPPLSAAIIDHSFTPAAKGFISSHENQNQSIDADNIISIDKTAPSSSGIYSKKIDNKDFLIHYHFEKPIETKTRLAKNFQNSFARIYL